MSLMCIILVFTFRDFAWLVARSTDSVIVKGIIKPVTLSEPNALTAKESVTAESIPPDRPRATPLEFASLTLVLMKLINMSKVSKGIFTIYEKEGTNLNLTILYYYGAIRDYAFSARASFYKSGERW